MERGRPEESRGVQAVRGPRTDTTAMTYNTRGMIFNHAPFCSFLGHQDTLASGSITPLAAECRICSKFPEPLQGINYGAVDVHTPLVRGRGFNSPRMLKASSMIS